MPETDRRREGDPTVDDLLRDIITHRSVQVAWQETRDIERRLRIALRHEPEDALPPQGLAFAVYSRVRYEREEPAYIGTYEPGVPYDKYSRGMVNPRPYNAAEAQGPYLAQSIIIANGEILAVGFDGTCLSFDADARDRIEFHEAPELPEPTR